MAQDKDLFSSEDLPEEGASSSTSTLPPLPPDATLPTGDLFKSADAFADEPPAQSQFGEFPKVELPTWPPVGEAPGPSPIDRSYGSSSAGSESAPPATPGDADSAVVPPSPFGAPLADAPASGAHLSLPSIDFSMPSFDVGSSAPLSGAGSASSSGDLPAHLYLPSFPEFDLPPIPGQENKVSSEGLPGGSFGLDPPGATPTTPGASHPDLWEIQAPAGGPPPPPPRRKKKTDELPDLPNMGLPEIAQKKKPALLRSDAAIDVRGEAGKKKLRLSMVLFVLAVVGVLAAVGAVIKLGPAGVLAYFNPEVDKEVELSAAQKAEKSFIEGFEVYKLAEEAEKSKNAKEAQRKFRQAVALFEKAVAFDPSMDKAHRSLGITLAKVKENDKAVGHYRRYLELAPNSADAAKVRKFVSDYETSQKGKRKR